MNFSKINKTFFYSFYNRRIFFSNVHKIAYIKPLKFKCIIIISAGKTYKWVLKFPNKKNVFFQQGDRVKCIHVESTRIHLNENDMYL